MKTLTIEQLAEKLKGKLWIKGDMKRIYLDCGHNTRKMSTKTYVFQRQDGTFGVSCTIDCPSQHDNWIEKEQTDIIESLSNRIDETIEEFGIETEMPAIIQIEDNSPEVQGYFLEWREVRLYDGPYGRKRDVKRKFVVTFTGQESKAPKGFIKLVDEYFQEALIMEKYETKFEYDQEPDFSLVIQRRKEQADKEKQLKVQESLEKFESNGISNALIDWMKSGFIHPAPFDVVKEKETSGLNWKKFQAAIERMVLNGGTELMSA